MKPKVLALPSIDKQRAASNRLLRSEAAISTEEKELAKLYNLKSGLMADLLTGRVPVPQNV
jgi:type I restriction enzyme, S subunit